MGALSRGGSIAAWCFSSREARLRSFVNAAGVGNLLLGWHRLASPHDLRESPGLQVKCDALLVQEKVTGLASGVSFIQHKEVVHLRELTDCGNNRSFGVGRGKEVHHHRHLDLDVRQGTGCACKEVMRETEFRVLASGEGFAHCISSGGLTPGELTNCGRTSLEAEYGKEINHSNFDMNTEQPRECVCKVKSVIESEVRADELNTAMVYNKHKHEIQHLREHFICNEGNSVPLRSFEDVSKVEDLGLDGTLELGRAWPAGLCQSRRNRPARDSETGIVLVNVIEAKTNCAEVWQGKNHANSLANLNSEAASSSKSSRGITTEDAPPNGQAERVQSQEGNRPQSNLPGSCSAQYPVPLSPLSGEVARSIEYERAMVAETAMTSGPAMTKSGVLFEDEWLVVINKPCGVYAEHVLATVPNLLTPTDFQARDSSLSRLTLRRPVDNKDTSGPHFHMANRLDRDTSGVMVITKCKNAAGKLSNIFTKRQVQKSYIALCRGPRPSWTKLTVDSGHGRSKFGAWRVYSKKDVGRGLPGGSVVRDMTTHLLVVAVNKQVVHDEQVDARTLFEEVKEIENHMTAGGDAQSGILRTNPCYVVCTSSEESSDVDQLSRVTDEVVIRAIPLTGRTHQIRLHCQFVGMPLRGDVKYGGPHFISGVRYDHHALHAESLAFKHPFTFEDMHFVAPLPQWVTDAGMQPLVW